MEEYIVDMDWRNQYNKNVNSLQVDIQTQHNLIKNPNWFCACNWQADSIMFKELQKAKKDLKQSWRRKLKYLY